MYFIFYIPSFIYNFKYKLKTFCTRIKTKDGIDVETYINTIEEKNNLPLVFTDIFYAYYNNKKVKEKISQQLKKYDEDGKLDKTSDLYSQVKKIINQDVGKFGL